MGALTPAALVTTPREPALREVVPTRSRVRLRDLKTTWEVTRIVGDRDIKIKYKQSILGPIWLVLQPLGMLLAVTIAFSSVLGVETGGVPYIVFALVGLMVWNFMQLVLSAGTMVLIANHTLIRRSACPRIALMNAQVVSNVPFFATLLAAAIIASIIAQGVRPSMLLLPALVVWLFVLTWGALLLTASIGARFRDSISALPLVLQAGIFLAPVAYPADQADGAVRTLLGLNPVTGLIETMRWCLLGLDPELYLVGLSLLLTALVTAAGWYVFTRMEVRFADFI